MFPPIEPKANLALNSCLQAPRISLAQSRVSRQIYQPSCGVFADVKEDSASIVGRNLLYRILMAAFSRLMITARRWLSSLSYSPINRNWSNRPRNFNIELADESPHPELRRSYLGNQNNATVQRVQASAETVASAAPLSARASDLKLAPVDKTSNAVELEIQHVVGSTISLTHSSKPPNSLAISSSKFPAKGSYFLHLGVRDASTDLVGALEIPITVSLRGKMTNPSLCFRSWSFQLSFILSRTLQFRT
jgi:hypothetical protein